MPSLNSLVSCNIPQKVEVSIFSFGIYLHMCPRYGFPDGFGSQPRTRFSTHSYLFDESKHSVCFCVGPFPRLVSSSLNSSISTLIYPNKSQKLCQCLLVSSLSEWAPHIKNGSESRNHLHQIWPMRTLSLSAHTWRWTLEKWIAPEQQSSMLSYC